jgi:hypothetical protein
MSEFKIVEGINIPLRQTEPNALFMTMGRATVEFKDGSKIEITTNVGAPSTIIWVTTAAGKRLSYIVDVHDIAEATVKAAGLNPEQ